MNITQIANRLQQEQVVAYPTEAVFGLGCNPMSESAVNKLLFLKQRPIEKGLILIAPEIQFLQPFIRSTKLDEKIWQKLTALYDRPITWIVPAAPNTPKWLTGQFEGIAIRLCSHPAVQQLCHQTGFALTSTSANLTGLTPCKTAAEVRSQFGEDFPVLDAPVGNAQKPSEIRDIFTDHIIRNG
ncbi:Sua5/YciO/YrdC/YwlC family protein [Conservatibacter flavescens]|uniref:Threonylcarbamoyl-AMP synthase n=1 Tax=Conservatibacter flavescens TaxID=28161 RepID=A0A2M8RZN5_9PAST|nr:Sua5/YciO/YrdC/YwlC family protein [Conservatibacter flavescens]PJG84336.1 tRNA threonylcarbamoyladenosine biosynthesis protein RimN [Conservatibacter flavescens]